MEEYDMLKGVFKNTQPITSTERKKKETPLLNTENDTNMQLLKLGQDHKHIVITLIIWIENLEQTNDVLGMKKTGE